MKITIENIKNIKKLEFNIPTRNGIYALTGTNGSGKTTLLACISRIKNRNAFQKYFKTSTDDKLDLFRGKIHYELNSNSVYYQYANYNWTAHPRSQSKLFNGFNYMDIALIPPNENRLFIHDKQLTIHRIKNAKMELIQYMNDIFGTTKFDNLKQINTDKTRGKKNRSKIAYLIPKKINNKTFYYSEKNFSLGEIIVLNLFLELLDLPEKSLILIDEIELALHPKVQIKLLDYLKSYSINKKSTIIISTHSISVIRNVNTIIFLKNTDIETEVIYNAYPAQAIGEIAYQDDVKPDVIFLVEDKMAKILLTYMLKKYSEIANNPLPDYKILPIGGYKNVVEFHETSRGYLFSNVPIITLLDMDVKDDVIPYLETNKPENTFYKLYKQLGADIQFLPITPELGLVSFIDTNKAVVTARLKSEFNDNSIDVNLLLLRFNEIVSIQNDTTILDLMEKNGQVRKKAKVVLSDFVLELSNKTNEPEEYIIKILNKIYIDIYFNPIQEQNTLKALFGRAFSQI